MQELELVFEQLKLGKTKDSPEIKTLLASIRQVNPELYPITMRIVENWPSANSTNSISKHLPSGKTLFGGGLGLATVTSIPWISGIMGWLEKNYPLSNAGITDPMSLLAIVAGLGAFAGGCYSIYYYRKIILPTFGKAGNAITLTQFGIADEMLHGLIASVATIWFVTVGLLPASIGTAIPIAPVPPEGSQSVEIRSRDITLVGYQETTPVPLSPTPEATTEQPKIRNDKNLLTYSVLFGSMIAGWYGARSRNLRLGQSYLQSGLAETATTEKLTPAEAQLIREAKTPAEAVAIAMRSSHVIKDAPAVPLPLPSATIAHNPAISLPTPTATDDPSI